MPRYSVTVSGDTRAELADNMAAFVNMLYASTAYSATPPTPPAEPEKRKRGRPPTKAKPALETATEAQPETVTEAVGEPAGEQSADAAPPPADAIGFNTAPENADALRKELRDTLTALHGAKGLNYVVRVLQQFNADRVSSVKPELLGRAIAEAKQYLAQQ